MTEISNWPHASVVWPESPSAPINRIILGQRAVPLRFTRFEWATRWTFRRKPQPLAAGEHNRTNAVCISFVSMQMSFCVRAERRANSFTQLDTWGFPCVSSSDVNGDYTWKHRSQVEVVACTSFAATTTIRCMNGPFERQLNTKGICLYSMISLMLQRKHKCKDNAWL